MSPSLLSPTRRPATVSPLCAAVLAETGLAGAAPHVEPPHVEPSLSAVALPYQDPSLPVVERVDDLLVRMTLDDEPGQMTQAEQDALVPPSDLATYRIGPVLSGGDSTVGPNARAWADTYDFLQRAALGTPLGIPMIYGIDAAHGHNAARGATIFPHDIGLGATRGPALVQRLGRAVSGERAGTGIDRGVDRGDPQLTEAELHGRPPASPQEAVRRGVGAVMLSYSSWNGARSHAHKYRGSFAAGRDTGDIQVRPAKSDDWSAFDEAGDHRRTTASSCTDAPEIPGYVGTALAWGTPPA